ncbi:MAG: glycosyltransferase, partial [Candidatus Polarisedimenticolia bacterium]
MASLLQCLRELEVPPNFEVVLVDGGSRDGTPERFASLVREGGPWLQTGVLVSPARGRAVQMNAGARVARGEVLLFLHADTRLPPDALSLVAGAMTDPAVVGGGFRHRFDEDTLLLRLISLCATLRSR